jgi:hypothetical protein
MAPVSTVTAPPSVPFWDTNPNALSMIQNSGMLYGATEWDIVRYGPQGIPMPGLAVIRKAKRKQRMDKKYPPGTDGVSPTFQGYNPYLFDFELLIWTPEQLNRLVTEILPIVLPGKGQPVFKKVPVVTGYAGFSGNAGSGQQGPEGLGFAPLSAGYTGAAPIVQQASVPTGAQLQIPVQLSHPLLLLHGVTSVIFEEDDGPMPWRGHNDIFAWGAKTFEFKPPKRSQTQTPAATTTLTTGIGAQNQPVSNSAAATDPAMNGGAAPSPTSPGAGASGTW